MLDKLKQEAMRHGFKLISNPKVMKLMADPRVMNTITQGYALKGRLQSTLEGTIRSMAGALNLATRDDVSSLQRSLSQVEASLNTLEKKVDQ